MSPASAPPKIPEQNVVPELGAVAVRMLVGPLAGQVVRVTRAEATRLCGDAWQPQAEFVSISPVETRETR